MHALVALIMRGRSHAMTASAVFAMLFMLPPFGYFSGAVIGLVTLKQGPREGLLVIGGSLALICIFIGLVVGLQLRDVLVVGMVILGSIWLPAWLMAMVVRTTRSQGLAVMFAGLVGVLVVLAMHLSLGDPSLWWHAVLSDSFARFANSPDVANNTELAQTGARMKELAEVLAPQMTRSLAVGLTASLSGTLFLARYWHSMLDNSGGFGREFRQLKVARSVIWTSGIVGLATLLLEDGASRLAQDVMGPLAIVVLVQGLAVVHSLARAHEVPVGWLVAMYVLLLFLPALVMPLLVAIGLADGLMDLRARFAGRES